MTGVGCVYFDSQATVAQEDVFAPMTGKWITSFLSDALFTNLLITGERHQMILEMFPLTDSAGPTCSAACIPDMEVGKAHDGSSACDRVVAHPTDHT